MGLLVRETDKKSFRLNMYSYLIREMVTKLQEKGCLNQDPLVVEQVLQDYWRDKIAITWHVEDVLAQAQQLEKELSQDEAREILQRLLHKHDATLGITWQHIQIAIKDYKAEQQASNQQ